jgi:hypothetical protein
VHSVRRSSPPLAALVLVASAVLFWSDTAPAAPVLSIAGEGELTVTGSGGDTASTEVVVVNPGEPVPISVTFHSTGEGTVVVTSLEPEEAAKGATLVKVEFSGLSKLGSSESGALEVKGGAAPLVIPTKVARGLHSSASWPVIFVVGAFVVMLLLLLAILLKAEKPGNETYLKKRAPGPKWSFSSWATTLTAVGGLLGTVAASASYPPEPIEISKDSLVSLSLLFAALVVIGPFIFQALRTRTAIAADQDEGLWGYSWALLLSCAITCGAVLGQLACLALLTQELITGGVWAVLALLAVIGLGFLALGYFWQTAWSLATTDWEAMVAEAEKKAAVPLLVKIAGNGETPRFLGIAGGDGENLADVEPVGLEVTRAAPQPLSWSLP